MKKECNVETGLRVRESRERLGYSREALAERADLAPSFLASIELGTSSFSAETLRKLCKTLGVSADFILFGAARTTAYDGIAEMLSGLDAKYAPHAEALIAAYVKSVLSAQEN